MQQSSAEGAKDLHYSSQGSLQRGKWTAQSPPPPAYMLSFTLLAFLFLLFIFAFCGIIFWVGPAFHTTVPVLFLVITAMDAGIITCKRRRGQGGWENLMYCGHLLLESLNEWLSMKIKGTELLCWVRWVVGCIREEDPQRHRSTKALINKMNPNPVQPIPHLITKFSPRQLMLN